ncbi:MAG: DUF1015 domain-containing protein [Candidatus Omnitrophica bacterium]|nr:DUF1015 domain-containing protein [Candidatus Omnitrophota bacterium]
MSNIRPFKAIHYNTEKLKDLSKLVSPPYDIISEEEQGVLQSTSQYNFTHIDLPAEGPGDDKYSRARKIFDDWQAKGILVQDETPAFYFYRQEYKMMGQKYSRFGFIGALELSNEGESKIYPHENTHAHAVDDRFKLTKALAAQLSCIFVCFCDRQKVVENIFNKKVYMTAPMIEAQDIEGASHKLWKVSDPALIKEIQEAMKGEQIFIADGHHRFKMAGEYRNMRLSKEPNAKGDAPYNYVMTYFTNIDSKDLKIFPMHRIIKSMPKSMANIEEFFRIDKIKDKDDLLVILAQAGKNENAFGLYTREGIKLFRLKNKMLIDSVVKEGSKDYKMLDAVILKYFVFDKIGIKSDDILYTKDMDSAIRSVDKHETDAVFILNPVKVSQLKAIALNGEKMPPKTTYFYPKVLSGLTVYKID